MIGIKYRLSIDKYRRNRDYWFKGANELPETNNKRIPIMSDINKLIEEARQALAEADETIQAILTQVTEEAAA